MEVVLRGQTEPDALHEMKAVANLERTDSERMADLMKEAQWVVNLVRVSWLVHLQVVAKKVFERFVHLELGLAAQAVTSDMKGSETEDQNLGPLTH